MRTIYPLMAGLLMLILATGMSYAQCLPDDSIRKTISTIKDAKYEQTLKISQLSKLAQSYVKCHPKPGSVYAEIIHRIGDSYSKTGDFAKAIEYTSRAVEINTHTGQPEPFLCNSFFNLGIFYKQLFLLNESNECFSRAIEIGRKFKDKYLIAGMAYEQLSFIYFQMGDYQQSRDIAANGLRFAGYLKDTLIQAFHLALKAQAETNLNNFIAAKQSISQSLLLLKDVQTDTLATAYSVFANLLNATGESQKAASYYKKAFSLNEKLGNTRQCSRDLMDLGLVLDEKLGQQNNARIWYMKSLRLAENNKDDYQIAGLYTNIGLTYWRNGQFAKALNFYQKGLISLPINFKDSVYTSNPKPEMLRLIFNGYIASILLANKGECLLDLYKKTRQRPVLDAALETFLLADKTVDMMRWSQFGEQSKLLWRRNTKEMYKNALEVCYLLNDTKQAYYFFEKSRAALLNDQLNRVAQMKLLSPEDRETEVKILVQLNNLNLKLQSINSSLNVNSSLYNSWLTQQKKWDDLQTKLAEKYVNNPYFTKSTIDPISTVQESITRNKQSLVEYFNSDSIVYALSVTPSKTTLYKILFPSYLHDAGNFLKYCSDVALLNQNHSQYVSLASQFYQKLFKPLQLQTQRVIISPGDNFIPFDALLDDPKSDSSFLLKKHAFSYVYSMSVLLHKNEHIVKNRSDFLGIAPENFATSLHLQPLTGSLNSLERIQSSFNSSLLLHGDKANKETLLTQLPGFQIVQIYSHADANNTSMEPVLYMADSTVNLSEIQKLNLPQTDLVVLSACNTGIGYNATGEGVFSLARGFRLAGIPSTVINLWQADNQATYKLTETFYKFIKLGLPKDVALQKAKIEFIKDGTSDYSLPFFWGATIVLGDTAALRLDSNTHYSLYVTVAAISATIVLGIFFYFLSSKRSNSSALKT